MFTSMIMAGCTTNKEVSASGSSNSNINAIGWNRNNETSANDSTTIVAIPGKAAHGISGGRHQMTDLPMTRIYKMNGDYADLVPVTLNQARNTVVSYPAPSDLRNSEPVRLADGFLLDRRGIGLNTVFTRWTYEDYSALLTAPAPKEILANINPDARLTELYEMPFPVGTPNAAERCDSLIKTGLPGCQSLILSLKLD